MSEVRALAAAGLGLVAAAALAPAIADDAPAASPMAGQGQTQGQAPDRPAAGDNGSGAPIDGKMLFATTCGFCHEDGGRKAGRGPQLAGTERSDEFIINRITNGKPGKMPAFGRAYSPEKIMQILAYIRSLEP